MMVILSFLLYQSSLLIHFTAVTNEHIIGVVLVIVHIKFYVNYMYIAGAQLLMVP